ncbi:MAG TPA: SAM-dependent methyltransferase [Arenimonas sp.]|nr:SAM-dependent methyltransferase [Arenimonas sp.]
MKISLPEASPEALAHSQAFTRALKQHIRENNGAIPFSRFMELALYAPGMGYYSAGSSKFGAEGDFVTSPELGAIFAKCIATASVKVLQQLEDETVFFELGGGSGAFAEHALKQFFELNIVPTRYCILEPSADLRERQRQRLKENLPAELFSRCEWLDGPFESAWQGVLFANEVLDALPTPRFVVREGEVYEEMVVLDANENFIRVDQPADAMLRAAVRHIERDTEVPFAEDYCSEVLPQLPYWIQAVGGLIEKGVMLFVDYGYPRREYYLPERSDGTLVCHYRHHAHNDPFYLPGLQDITAFVDFTAVAEAGVNAGFDLSGYCSQASFLIGNGLPQAMQAVEDIEDEVVRYRLHQEIKKLTLPGEMGERFQVIGFQRDVEFRDAFAMGNLSRRL